MKRNYRYEKEMLHWLDGGEIEQKYDCYEWEPFDGVWDDNNCQFRIVEPAEKPKEERWLYVNKVMMYDVWIPGATNLSTTPSEKTIGKIRMEDV